MPAVFKVHWEEAAIQIAQSPGNQVPGGHGLNGFVREEIDREFIQGNEARQQVEHQAKHKKNGGSS